LELVYKKASKEKEEVFGAKITGTIDGLYYRIVREDGGFNTGLKKLQERINEDLPLVEGAYNYFKLSVFDSENNPIETDFEMIGINSGFEISQPLPDDISLEIDDYDKVGFSKLQLIFQKNSGLPLKTTFTKQLNKTVLKGSSDDIIRINIVEGPSSSLPEANKSIGFFTINGKNISRDVYKGSDIEFTISVSESRALTLSVYLNMIDQEFKMPFNLNLRDVSIDLLQVQMADLFSRLEDEIEEATNKQEFETAGSLTRLKKELEFIKDEANSLSDNDVTNKRYQLEDKKRKIAQEIDTATKNKRISLAKEQYFSTKKRCNEHIDDNGNDYERKAFKSIESQENTFLTSNSIIRIQEKIDELQKIIVSIRWRTPELLKEIFNWLKTQQPKMNNQSQAKSLIDAGKFAIESENWVRLKEINSDLFDLLPEDSREEGTTRIGF
jgi:molecular chaperone DnaK